MRLESSLHPLRKTRCRLLNRPAAPLPPWLPCWRLDPWCPGRHLVEHPNDRLTPVVVDLAAALPGVARPWLAWSVCRVRSATEEMARRRYRRTAAVSWSSGTCRPRAGRISGPHGRRNHRLRRPRRIGPSHSTERKGPTMQTAQLQTRRRLVAGKSIVPSHPPRGSSGTRKKLTPVDRKSKVLSRDRVGTGGNSCGSAA